MTEMLFDFPKPLDYKKAPDLARFIKDQIGANADIGFYDDTVAKIPVAFIFKEYEEGIAYTIMNFVSCPEGHYAGITLRAETPFENRRELTRKLHEEISNLSYEEFFLK